MKTFRTYYREREEVALGDMSMNTMTPNNNLLDIAKIAIDDHPDEVENFFRKLAKENHRIKIEFQRYLKDKAGYEALNKDTSHKPEPEVDEIVPNRADGFGEEDE